MEAGAAIIAGEFSLRLVEASDWRDFSNFKRDVNYQTDRMSSGMWWMTQAL